MGFLFKRHPQKIRKELRLVGYAETEYLLKHGWTLAKEEDNNHKIGMVYLEFLIEEKQKMLNDVWNEKEGIYKSYNCR